MYLTGTQYNLENRLHSLPTSSDDASKFRAEVGFYLETRHVNVDQSGRWDRELKKKTYQVTPTIVSSGISWFSYFYAGTGWEFVGTSGIPPVVVSVANDLDFGEPSDISGVYEYLFIKTAGMYRDEFKIINSPNLKGIYFSFLDTTNCTSFQVSDCPQLKEIVGLIGSQDLFTITRTSVTSLDFSDYSVFGAIQNLNVSDNALTYLNMRNIHNLDVCDLHGNNLTYVDGWMDTPPGLGFDAFALNFSNNLFNSAEIDRMLILCEAKLGNGAGATLSCSGNLGQPTDTSLAARQALSGRGWTISH